MYTVIFSILNTGTMVYSYWEIIMEKYLEEYGRWLASEEIQKDSEIYEQLTQMRWNESAIKENFSRYLHFGTSGLRGIMGAGTDKMNVYIVRKVTQGVAEYMRKNFDDPAVVIAYDSRRNSFEFAKATAEVMAGNGIPVYMFREMTPVPVLSYAIRNLDVSLGIAVTASHNSKEYNGYKVYGSDGYQITGDVPAMILDEIDRIDIFDDIRRISYEDALLYSICIYVDDAIIQGYYREVRKAVTGRIKRRALSRMNRYSKKILYTPLYGTGYSYVSELCPGFEFLDSQIEHDGDFPTAPYPNLEKESAFREAIRACEVCDADYIFATDPDSDRFGMAVKTPEGFRLLTGNEIGILLFSFICETRKLQKNSVAYRSIVTTNMADAIAARHKVEMKKTLTGFKYIGEKLSSLDDEGRFVFAFEESNGFLAGTYSMDKDGVCTCLLAEQMIGYYGDILEKLDKLYRKYGYYVNRNYEYAADPDRISDVMAKLREEKLWENASVTDYLDGIYGFPQSDILQYTLGDGCQIYIRPSGTEPKLKAYIFSKGKTYEDAERIADSIMSDLVRMIEGD